MGRKRDKKERTGKGGEGRKREGEKERGISWDIGDRVGGERERGRRKREKWVKMG